MTRTDVQHEQSRASYPDETGFVERDGVQVFWERYGDGEQTILLLPTWQIVHSRVWKAQIPFLARHFRVVTFDPRGNGRSDRPDDPAAYDQSAYADDAVAVLDAVGVERAVVVSLSLGAQRALLLADEHPERVAGAVFICPAVALAPAPPERRQYSFEETHATDAGWAKDSRSFWLRDWHGYLEFFFSQMFSERHSTKQIDDAVGWGLETDAATVLLGEDASFLDEEQTRGICSRFRGPSLVVQGAEDRITGVDQGIELARALGCELVTFEGSGHGPQSRDPVAVNLLLRDFVRAPVPAVRWVRAGARPRRALFVSSPIGLGHARRDVAIARELRRLRPGLEIDWLAQDPVTQVLEAAGERIHPASALLASESAHIVSESSGHELACFEAIRRMDEILLANFMVFHEVVSAENYDLWIGDEAWDVDYYLHENPELKTAAYVWLSDFVGWLPMPAGGEREAFLTADYNAEMIEQIARYPRVRDRAIFVGEPDDIVPGTFGPGLPEIRRWTEQHFAFSGYITGFDDARSPTAARCAPSWATPTTSRSASSPSAARASAVRCCAASWSRSRRPSGSCLVYGWWWSPARGSTRRASAPAMVSRSTASSPTSTGTLRRATWPSFRAA